MTVHSDLPALFSGLEQLQEKGGQVFMLFGESDPQLVAQAFKRMGARLVTLTFLDEELAYIYEVANRLYWVQLPVTTPMKSVGPVFACAKPIEAYISVVFGLSFDPPPEQFFVTPSSTRVIDG